MNTSENIKNIAIAMIEVEKEIKGMTPDAKNPFFKSNYITLDGILEYARPILAKNGIWAFQNAASDGEYVELTTRLVHSSGEYIETDILKMKPQKNDPQQLGSCITYAKRYQLAAILGISSEIDDDGNKATFGNGNKANRESIGSQNQHQEGNHTLSDKQVARAVAIGTTHGIDIMTIKKQIMKDYKATDIAQLTKQQYDELCTRLEKAGEKGA